MENLVNNFYNIEETPFPLLAKEAQEKQFSGVMQLERGHSRKAIFFSCGQICSIQSNHPDELFGSLLVRAGLLSARDNALSLKRSTLEALPQGQILTRSYNLKQAEIDRMLQQQLETRLLEIFEWENGQASLIKRAQLQLKPRLTDQQLNKLLARGIRELAPNNTIINALGPYLEHTPSLKGKADRRTEQLLERSVFCTLASDSQAARELLALYCDDVIQFVIFDHAKIRQELLDALEELREPCSTDDPDAEIVTLKQRYSALIKKCRQHSQINSELIEQIQRAYAESLRSIRELPKDAFNGIYQQVRAEYIFENAVAQSWSHNHRQAAELFQQALKLYPASQTYAEAYAKSIFLSWQNGSTTSAQSLTYKIDRLVEKFPDSAKLQLILGWIHKQNNPERAYKHFRKAQRLNPESLEARRELRLIDMRLSG